MAFSTLATHPIPSTPTLPSCSTKAITLRNRETDSVIISLKTTCTQLPGLRTGQNCCVSVTSCLPSSSSSSPPSKPKTRLFVSGLSFRTTEETLRNAFENFGQLVEVNLVMDKIANRPRGFAFLRYKTEEESQKAIEGMHGKFLDGRVIFVEVAKPRSELRPPVNRNPRRF